MRRRVMRLPAASPSPAASTQRVRPRLKDVNPRVITANRQKNQANAEIAIVAVTAPPMRGAICAKGIRSIRLAAVKIATSPADALLARLLAQPARRSGMRAARRHEFVVIDSVEELRQQRLPHIGSRCSSCAQSLSASLSYRLAPRSHSLRADFKTFEIRRAVDPAKSVLVYTVVSTKLINGSPFNSITWYRLRCGSCI
jgi:hypothetical protein